VIEPLSGAADGAVLGAIDSACDGAMLGAIDSACDGAVLGAGVAPPPEHAAATIATAPTSDASLRCCFTVLFSSICLG
jgi:hypothetical protein